MNFRKEARNRPCTIRVPGICDGGGETTVLCHFRLAGTCGTGIKPPDLMAAWGCGPCHDYVGDRSPELAIAVMRTQNKLIEEGKL